MWQDQNSDTANISPDLTI